MKVAIFVDGKNFYSGYRAAAPDRRIDFPKLAAWLVAQVHGSMLWGAYYYTGIETGVGAETDEQKGLARFLDMLEEQPGFFVFRFPRKTKTARCQTCQALNSFSQEKEVDTTMVADMLRLAAVNAFDMMVLVSGDADHAPAIEGVRSVGKQAFVATWAGAGLSARSRKAAFDHIDLATGLDFFGAQKKAEHPTQVPAVIHTGHAATADADQETPRMSAPSAPTETTDAGAESGGDSEFIDELKRAEAKFAGAYVGLNYFVTRWAAPHLTKWADERRRILDRLVETGRVERYTAPDGKLAIRAKE